MRTGGDADETNDGGKDNKNESRTWCEHVCVTFFFLTTHFFEEHALVSARPVHGSPPVRSKKRRRPLEKSMEVPAASMEVTWAGGARQTP